MAKLTSAQQHRIDGITNIVEEFMDVRFEHACRINGRIEHIIADIKWQQLRTLGEVFLQPRGVGENRFLVIDLLCGDNMELRESLFLFQGQNSICQEIIVDKERSKQARVSGIAISDITSFYHSLEPSLENILELLQTWIWWDLQDATDFYLFDQQVAKIGKIYSSQLNDALLQRYRRLFHRGEEEKVTKQEILIFEVARSETYIKGLIERKGEEKGFQMAIKCENLSSESLDDLILQLAPQITTLRTIQQTKSIDVQMKQRYAETIGCSPEQVTLARAIDYEEHEIERIKKSIATLLSTGRILGTPYDYKLSKMNEYRKKSGTIITKLKIDTSKAIRVQVEKGQVVYTM